jgi:aspartyl aminopeptidase
MSFPTAQIRERQRERIKYWLQKDQELTNRQISELTGATENFVSKMRKELGVPANFSMPTHSAVDAAFKKVMQEQGRPIQRQSKEFNPWPSVGKGIREDK